MPKAFRSAAALVAALCLLLSGVPAAAANQWPDAGPVKESLEQTLHDQGWSVFEAPSAGAETLEQWLRDLLEPRPGAPLLVALPDVDGEDDGEDPVDPGPDPGAPPSDGGSDGGSDVGGGGDGGDGVTVTTMPLLAGTSYQTEAVFIRSAVPGPTVLVVGGVHGDQPAGVEAARHIARIRNLLSGTLIVIPEVNAPAVAAGTRTAADGVDVNRAFPTHNRAQSTDPRAAAVWDIITQHKVDMVLDLHEAADYQAVSSSIGQTVIFYELRGTAALGNMLVAAVNRHVSGSRIFRTGGPAVEGGLTRAAAEVLGLNAFHITTTRKDPLPERVGLHRVAVGEMLVYLGMQEGRVPELPSVTVTTETLMPGTKYATTLYIIDSGQPGPTVWISGGVHGSELAGWKAADQIKDWGITRGRLIVLPRTNMPAVNNQTRSGPGDPDLNRQFPTTASGTPKTALARSIWSALQRHRPDWVIDLHEALSARNINSNSVGQTLIAYPRGDIIDVGNAIFREMNRSISDSRYRFQVIRNPIQSSLARAAGQFLGAKAGIFETTRLVALNTRIQWQLQFTELLLQHLQMQPSRTRISAVPAPAAVGAIAA